jgi:2,4-dienoyl-CoA reductase-like NADH-dependent reductase (Old Yellow Enzyme family)
MMSSLFDPISLGSLHLENRIVIAPMCQYSAIDGKVSSWHFAHLGQLSFSGAGLLILEATAVVPEGRISANDLGLWDDDTEQSFVPLLAALRKHSAMPLAIQLGHAGRKASCLVPWQGGGQCAIEQGGWQTQAPSPLAFSEHDTQPDALSDVQIKQLIEAFRHSAQRAARLGFDAIEIHAAHGYLLHQFLSPLSNQRTDQYGGSLENRMRLLLEVFEAIKQVCPQNMAIGVRISASDWVDGGWDVAQSTVLAQHLEKVGCAYLHVSSGGLSAKQHIHVGPHYQVPFASQIRQHTQMPIIAVGLITDPQAAQQIIQSEQADMVALARGILYDPRWPWHAAAALGAKVHAPRQYWRCEPHGISDLFIKS